MNQIYYQVFISVEVLEMFFKDKYPFKKNHRINNSPFKYKFK